MGSSILFFILFYFWGWFGWKLIILAREEWRYLGRIGWSEKKKIWAGGRGGFFLKKEKTYFEMMWLYRG